MSVYDTGPIDNRTSQTRSLSIRLNNGGQTDAIASIQVYGIEPNSGGFSNPY